MHCHPFRSLLLALGAMALTSCTGGEPAPERPLGPADGHDLPAQDLERIQVGEPAPDFTLASLDQGPVTLSDFRGEKEVVLVFYRGHW